MIGHGGIVVFDDTADMAAQADLPWNSAWWNPAVNAHLAE